MPEQRWDLDPWQDSCQSTFGHAWETVVAAIGCALFGHRGKVRPPLYDGDGAWRTCDRCGGKWAARPPSTPGEEE